MTHRLPSNFVKGLFVLTLIVLSPRTTWAEGISFSLSSPAPYTVQENAEQQATIVSNLKQRAVTDYLARIAGNKFSQIESGLTKEFTERHILDYRVHRLAGNPPMLEVTGHIDSDGLKRWFNSQESRVRSSAATLKPFFIVSSTVPGFSFSASETQQRLLDNVFATNALSVANHALQKFGQKIVPPDNRVSLSQPPRGASEMKQLRDFGNSGGFNSALWIALSPCKGCTGLKLDTYLYNLSTSRLVYGRTDELPMEARELSREERVRPVLKSYFQPVQTEVEELLAQGTLFSQPVRLRIEGVEGYRKFRNLDQELAQLDFVSQVTLKKVEPGVAEFELLSTLSADEAYQRMVQGEANALHLKPLRIDSPTMFMRLLN